jgi:hypothetical protein
MGLELHDLLLAEFAENGEGPHYYNCWNLCREVCRRAGYFLPKYSEYISGIDERNNVIEGVRGDFIQLDKPEPFCVVTFNLRPDKITHMGIILDKYRFIHMRKRAGVAIERLDTRKWSTRIEGYYRYAADNQA